MALAHPTAVWRVGALLACAAAIGWAAPGTAQTFYKWTDDRGVVHFSDSLPPSSKNVEERSLSVPPVVTRPGDAADDAGTATAATSARPDQPGAAAPSKGGEGPAKVIMVASKSPRTGPSTMRISGKVKNVGGENAKSVAVAITAVDSTQGTSCLDDEAEVIPGTLGPGETGNFDLNLDSPCLYGDTNVDLQPVWE